MIRLINTYMCECMGVRVRGNLETYIVLLPRIPPMAGRLNDVRFQTYFKGAHLKNLS